MIWFLHVSSVFFDASPSWLRTVQYTQRLLMRTWLNEEPMQETPLTDTLRSAGLILKDSWAVPMVLFCLYAYVHVYVYCIGVEDLIGTGLQHP